MQPDQRPIRIIGVACGRGSPDIRCGEGPDALRDAGLLERLSRIHAGVSWEETLRCESPEASPFEAVAELCPRLARTTASTSQAGALPLVLTGDHSCAIGTWAGVSASLARKGPLGLVWIDAHLDSHTPDTSHTGAIHGMPLAALLGYGEDRLTGCGGPGAKLLPGNLCIVGARSYESEELQFLNRLGVRIYFMDEIARRGIDAVMRDAVELVRADTAAFGLSIDLDAIDPREAPGVGTPAAQGIAAPALAAALRGIGNDPGLAGIEISEYNPARDRDSRTAVIAIELLESVFFSATASAQSIQAGCAQP